ncbi:hypothetical protein ACP70R_004117 [Stipagrostis hirtigluma subsp. patula]
MSGMEAALASGLLKVVGSKLFAMISSEFSSIIHVKKDLSDLRDVLEPIASRLSALQHREIERDPSFRWVKKLKVFCYDIEDLLDEVKIEAEKQNRDSDDENHTVAHCFCAKPKSFMFRCKMAHKIKAIKARLDEIVKQLRNIYTILQSLPVDPPVSSRSDAAAELYLLANVEESKIPRRDQEKDQVISKILEFNDGANVLIASIVGIGGSGKTTLAKHICDDEKIEKHFKDIFKVHVSREFDVDRLIGKLFEEITKEKSDLHPRSYMVNKISNKLSKDKFLLVLDDAWHKNRHDWEQFLLHVKSGTPGSMVLLTTRDEEVARAVESWYTLKLEFLSERESWNFFLKISGWTEDEGSELIEVGRQIVKKCGGVPLAIRILGGVLRGKSEINTWRAIRGSSLWNDENIEVRVFGCLKLSYIHLENYLKPCFTFCSIFPKGYQINKNRLIAQWIVHGLVNPRNEERPEDIGNDYFDSLVNVGFLQEVLEYGNDEVKYKMHDLIHDLAQNILEPEVMTSLVKNVPTYHRDKFRYLSLTSMSCSQKVDGGLFDKVRALHLFDFDGNQSFDESLKKSRYIHSVVLHYATHMPFPLFILKFKHLGYLEIYNFSCIELPEAISGCWNLQALYFINCNGFVTLPKSMGKLKKLRILELMSIIDLESLPQSIGDCRDLQCLRICSCVKLREIPDSIGKIENLRVLHIAECANVQQLSFGSVGQFRDIDTINLAGCTSLRDLPSAFASHTLRTLDLSRTIITTLPQWVTLTDSLECINLQSCRELVELPTGIGNLQGLKVLCIEGCNKLRCMPPGIGQLTHLTSLGLFVVGCSGDDARISELEHLDMISGDMIIRNIKYLKDCAVAEKGCLKRKTRIQSLTLEWSISGTEEELVWDMDQDLGVLSALEPPSKVESLVISRYGGPCLPHWMGEETDYSYWEGIVLKQTSPCQFPCLTRLILKDLPNLKHLRGLVELPLLTVFILRGMPNLEELYTTKGGLQIEGQLGGQYCFPVLSGLEICWCPKLNVKPYFPPSLVWLKLKESNEQLLSPSNFFHLFRSPVHESSFGCSSDLILEGMTGSSSGWEFLQHITGLEYLKICKCDDLTQLPESIRCLTSLRALGIEECPALGSLPEWLGELRCLEGLDVRDTPMITCLPQSVEHLTSLERLSIFGWSNMMTQLPEVIQHLTSLSVFHLEDCGGLTTLPEWMGQLSALQELCIYDCSALHSLPSSMDRLTALQRLFILGCPALTERYKEDVGFDWHLVSHIPCVRIW